MTTRHIAPRIANGLGFEPEPEVQNPVLTSEIVETKVNKLAAGRYRIPTAIVLSTTTMNCLYLFIHLFWFQFQERMMQKLPGLQNTRTQATIHPVSSKIQ